MTNLNNIPFKFVADFKLVLTVLGLQTATASYPSPFCLISLKSLRQNKTKKINCVRNKSKRRESDTSPKTENALKVEPDCKKMRTFGDIRKD